MAAYVDRAIWQWRGRLWCHLLADDLGELHDFARRLGMPRAAFQDRRYPHYDLPEERRLIAVELGAVQVTLREIIVVARRLREQRERESASALAPRDLSR
jgi:signal recognition particle subunit SEC65